jgi:predicted nuclease of predicted toxin-antitoxin system
MRFKIDENLHDEVATLFTSRGHDCQTVHVEGIRGCDDGTLAQHCLAEHRALVTLDLDFADLRGFPPAQHAGIIVLRLRDQGRTHILNVVARVLDLIDAEPVAARLWIVSEAGVRIRGG